MVLCIVTAEAGSLIAQYRLKSGIVENEAPISTAVAATLGLLAFMLGFTFSLTAERYSERKTLVLAHVNAIGTCYLRTSLIPEKQKLEIRSYCREYINVLLVTQSVADLEKTLAKIEEINLLIWQQTASLIKEEMDSEMRSIFTTSVNDLLNTYSSKKTVGLTFRIPDAIWVALLLLTATAMFSYGYQNGITGMSHIIQMPLLAVSFSMVVTLIAAMDSIGWQSFQISYEPLLSIKEMMEKDIP
ncbi:hypothetical protein [Pontibacter ruber]|uniref:DUF4239 domain-containing protein n=1 Tax=Pontibacter ruber TaxID=1343895 RepID=A0ABW5CVH0_9BACT|nr:hypothetical protein [Pontibacter ruber]